VRRIDAGAMRERRGLLTSVLREERRRNARDGTAERSMLWFAITAGQFPSSFG